MNRRQKALMKKHGTPEEFEKAVWRAYSDLFITNKEAIDAIDKYNNEWHTAGCRGGQR